MYVPRAFREDRRDELLDGIERWNFGLLISTGGGASPRVTPVPFRVERGDPAHLVTHLARANPQAAAIARAPDQPVTAFFLGPHAYVSPSSLPGAGESVPTWDYVAIEARGAARCVVDGERVARELALLSARHEGADGWSPAVLDPERRARLEGAVRVLEIRVDEIDGAWKLSQNKPAASRRVLARRLRAARTESAEAAIARLVGATLPARSRGPHRIVGALAARLRRWLDRTGTSD